MGFFGLFGKNDLTDDIDLEEYFDPFYHSGDVYVAAKHCVRKWVCIPDGPQGYYEIRIPEKIRTKRKLFAYLEKKHGFHKQ